MRLYLIRHADPDYAADTITEQGHAQARALADRLADEGLDRLYVSPLGRAQATLRYTAERIGRSAQVEDWIREIPGLVIRDPSGQRLAAWNVPGETVRTRPLPTPRNWHTRPPLDDPTFLAIYARLRDQSDQFLARHGYVRQAGVYRIVQPSRERIALFCHAGFGLTWLAHLLDLPLPLVWSGFFLAPSSVTIILMEERSPGHAVPRCLCVGDVSHIHAAGLPMPSSGITANWD